MMAGDSVDDYLAYFLDLRLRVRGNRQATALVDRCLELIARAEAASPAQVAALEREVEALRGTLIARFGRKAPIRTH
jgi:hypothetical protein